MLTKAKENWISHAAKTTSGAMTSIQRFLLRKTSVGLHKSSRLHSNKLIWENMFGMTKKKYFWKEMRPDTAVPK